MFEKLSKGYNYSVEAGPTGGRIVVERFSDKSVRVFNLAALKDKAGELAVTNFMNSMTDELLEGYWPKPRKK